MLFFSNDLSCSANPQSLGMPALLPAAVYENQSFCNPNHKQVEQNIPNKSTLAHSPSSKQAQLFGPTEVSTSAVKNHGWVEGTGRITSSGWARGTATTHGMTEALCCLLYSGSQQKATRTFPKAEIARGKLHSLRKAQMGAVWLC